MVLAEAVVEGGRGLGRSTVEAVAGAARARSSGGKKGPAGWLVGGQMSCGGGHGSVWGVGVRSEERLRSQNCNGAGVSRSQGGRDAAQTEAAQSGAGTGTSARLGRVCIPAPPQLALQHR